MATMKITEDQAARFLKARDLSENARREERKKLFAEIRQMHGISRNVRFGKIAIQDPANPLYLVLRDKRTNQPLTNSLPEPVVKVQAAAPAPVAASNSASEPAKPKAAGKPAPKAVKPAKAVKKAPEAAQPKATAPAKKPKTAKIEKPEGLSTGSKTQSEKYPLEVRYSKGQSRKRVGWASSEKMKAKMIAEYKAIHG